MTTTEATAAQPEVARVATYRQAVAEAIADAMREDDSIFVAGEDIGAYGGVFGAYRGLFAEFGGQRVVDTPISEAALVGLGIGAAASGCRPIIDMMFMDFIGIAMDQIVNQAAKMKYMFGGDVVLPLTIITMAGAGGSMAAQHSQSLEAWLCHVPGLKVVMPSGPYEAKGLIAASLSDDNPVIVVLNKLSLGYKADVPEAPYSLPLGKAEILRHGTDITVVALGRMVHEAQKAAGALASEGISVEVIDPRTLSPLDSETMIESVKRTNRALVAHEAVRFCGFGAELAAQLQEEAFDWLDGPIGRVGAPSSPVPFAPSLEKLYVPSVVQIVDAVHQTLTR